MSTPDPSLRRIALWGGVAYLATFVFSIPAVALLAPATDHVRAFMGGGDGDDLRVIAGGVSEMLNALACVATALLLHPVTSRVSRTLALGFVASRLLEAAIIMVGVVSILTVVTLRQDVGGAAASDGVVTTARALVDVRAWTFLLGPGVMPAFNALFLGTILYRSGLVPRALPLLGLVGAPLLVLKSLIVAFGAMGDSSAGAAVMALPIAAWELGLALWLTFKGFRSTTALS
ncbi:DUF4386 domain-containing protein [Nocardioides nematodiphilus]|uniref:DUF4386 domain-containing protein n=1 Tax=Nocardioides nematodiphilus TaxID=2849669 RepID=UPI001CDA034D|nr:DUF4386 domain-containing protein [Nocardioides nematodiphilus]MCA1984189.1 DUF4386 domain-containing protein [Nocardioides nematodiphilus]